MDTLMDITAGHYSPLPHFSFLSIEEFPTRHCDLKNTTYYIYLAEVVRDVHWIGKRHNEMLKTVTGLANHVMALKKLCQRLERRVVKLEDPDDELAFGKSTLALSFYAHGTPLLLWELTMSPLKASW